MILGLAYLSILITLYGYSFWLPQLIQSLGAFAPRRIGLLVSIPNVCAVLFMYRWGRYADHSAKRRWHTALPLLAAAAGFVVSAYSSDAAWATFGFTIVAVGIYCSLPVFWSLATSQRRGQASAAGIALVNSLGSIGGYIGPLLMGWLQQRNHGPAWGLLSLAGAAVVGSALVLSTPTSRESA